MLVIKQQSTVFQTPPILRKTTFERIQNKNPFSRVDREKENLKRTYIHNERSRILIDKCTGRLPPAHKSSVLETRDTMEDCVDTEESVEEPVPVAVKETPTRNESDLDKYVRLVMGKSQNIE